MKPFLNKSILVTRPVQQAEELILAILGFGGKVIGAPMMEIPEMAFAPLINGVWSVAGTFVMSSNPRKIASTNSVMFPIKNSGVIRGHLPIGFALDAFLRSDR